MFKGHVAPFDWGVFKQVFTALGGKIWWFVGALLAIEVLKFNLTGVSHADTVSDAHAMALMGVIFSYASMGLMFALLVKLLRNQASRWGLNLRRRSILFAAISAFLFWMVMLVMLLGVVFGVIGGESLMERLMTRTATQGELTQTLAAFLVVLAIVGGMSITAFQRYVQNALSRQNTQLMSQGTMNGLWVPVWSTFSLVKNWRTCLIFVGMAVLMYIKTQMVISGLSWSVPFVTTIYKVLFVMGVAGFSVLATRDAAMPKAEL